MAEFRYDVCVVGGCGHVGLPLALSFAREGLSVSVYDIDEEAIATVRAGRMPFMEAGAGAILRDVIGRSLEVANDPGMVAASRHIIVIIGTPVDEHLNPTFHAMRRFFVSLLPHLKDGQCLILRSTVFPGATAKVRELVEASGRDVRVAFCPERVAEGHAIEEFATLPQIVAGCDDEAFAMAAELFGRISRSIVRLEPVEAELSKIFTNAWRYIQFATANQFFMMATDFGVDFYRIFEAMTRDYPRMAGLPRGGFAAGPCLLKDTMQLAAAYENHFALGHAAMLVNEGLPNFIVRHLKGKYPLGTMSVGILGMAFKADSDDPRESLSYKLRKILEYEAREVLCTDPHIEAPSFLPLDEVLSRADLLIIGAPHREYRALGPTVAKPVIDIWNLFGKGAALT
ncbi:nucleotide sugar dehydrogenase [Singulisphaera sp. Ch08]|uniref:Nucleotide sugar dehydrogenase n=1 Tax=Singulisphaera sp. Ch08 TaxID=3120278 RepID=A0AAU7CA70_9BACT